MLRKVEVRTVFMVVLVAAGVLRGWILVILAPIIATFLLGGIMNLLTCPILSILRRFVRTLRPCPISHAYTSQSFSDVNDFAFHSTMTGTVAMFLAIVGCGIGRGVAEGCFPTSQEYIAILSAIGSAAAFILLEPITYSFATANPLGIDYEPRADLLCRFMARVASNLALLASITSLVMTS